MAETYEIWHTIQARDKLIVQKNGILCVVIQTGSTYKNTHDYKTMKYTKLTFLTNVLCGCTSLCFKNIPLVDAFLSYDCKHVHVDQSKWFFILIQE